MSGAALRDDYLARVARLAPFVAAYRVAIEQERRLPAPLFDAIVELGLTRLWLPRAFGGPELPPLDFMDVVEAASALDGSVGWVIGNGAGMSRVAGYLLAATAQKWFADPRAFVVSATGAVGDAAPVPGGYRVTGKWPFASGIHHATHAMGVCRRADDPQVLLWCYFPIGDVHVIDDWNVSGLRGTGSCDFTANDVFVPDAHAHPFPELVPTQPGIVYRLPGYMVLSWTVAVVPLGIARAAMDAFVELAARKVRFGTGVSLRERETVQAAFGHAQALHSAARLFLADAMRALEAEGAESDIETRARFRMACTLAGETASRIVEMLCSAVGAASIQESGVLARCQRDVQATSRHIAMSPNNYIFGGRIGLGLDAGTARI